MTAVDDDKYQHTPIPTYEEATSSNDAAAEREGLLGNTNSGAYRAPTVESDRSSLDSDLGLPEVDAAHRDIEQFDYLDPADAAESQRQPGFYHRARLRSKFSQLSANLSATISSIRLPSFRALYSPVPSNTLETPPAPEEPAPQPRPSRWCSLREPHFLQHRTIPEQYRPTAPLVARLFGLSLIAAFIYVLFILDLFPGMAQRLGAHFDPESVRAFVQDNVDVAEIAEFLREIASFDHVAGTKGDLYLARWMRGVWLERGGLDDVAFGEYWTFLDYPVKGARGLTVQGPGEGEEWEADLEEGVVFEAGEADGWQQTGAWHAYSWSGEVEGHLVFANAGGRKDFEWLREKGVETEGAVALVRAFGAQEDLGLKVNAAEKAGCAGVLVYSDPSDDGAEKGKVWPEGPWRPSDSLQRGAVSLRNWVMGDPLTPGWASTKEVNFIAKEDAPGLPKIPSLPLSWKDASELVRKLHKSGVEVPEKWVGGDGDSAKKWYSGEKSDKLRVKLKNHNDQIEKQEIWNLYGVINGIETPDKKVVVGNRRDAWCFGAADPGSGTAVMNEVISIFGQLRKLGWRPLRTIQFASWDAGTYNSAGSTEYVEDNAAHLRGNAFAYLNVAAGVTGTGFRANASPMWQKALRHVLGRVSDPATNSTLSQLWADNASELDPLGAGGDSAPWQNIAGASAIDFGFTGKPHAYPQGSCYDTFEWVQNFGDPGLEYHKTLAQVWALLILEIADRRLIPYDLEGYADALDGYIDGLEADLGTLYPRPERRDDGQGGEAETDTDTDLDLTPLRAASARLHKSASNFHRFEDVWTQTVRRNGGLESTSYALQRLEYNDRLARFESDLLELPRGFDAKDKNKHKDADVGEGETGYGLRGREQFKHVLFAPGKWGEGVEVLPGVRDALEGGEWGRARELVGVIAEVVRKAGERLVKI